ncbi:MAG: hypothetical protein JSS66_16430 [Armatimonadetes bacterium]|nr:hypothetical protein [Armatimonadota bacterium]
MKYALSLLSVTCIAAITVAQEEFPKASQKSQAYRRFREQSTEPSYGLSKVKALVRKLKPNEEDDRILPVKTYNALSVEERFTYTMIHAEQFSQNCSVMPPLVDEEKKIFAYPVGAFGDEGVWSDRQLAFLKNNRTKVVALLRNTIQKKGRVGVNLKLAIVTTNAIELIPDLERIYTKDRKDQDILTVLMLLMKEGKYGPFLNSASYKKLYGEDANWQAYLDASVANQKLILARASDFYKNEKH